jgi:diguanylate cyclase (GGDEF)-like protein
MSLKTINILLIEDSPTDADLIRRSLQEVAEVATFHVEHVDSLAAGIERLSSGDFDIVLSDLSLPDAEGLTSFQAITARAPRVPVVVLTGLDDATVAVEAVKAGAQDYLVKGDINRRVLARAICYAIERKKAEQAITELTRQLKSANAQLERLASVDPLTELLNRRGFENALAVEANRMARGASPAAAILLDCDDFKDINESFGHAVGDLVLKEIGRCLRASVRPSDHVSRIGGDEFLVLLPDTRLAEATQIAHRIRMAIASTTLTLPTGNVTLTASLGISMLPADVSSIEEILVATRSAMKQSKHLGKNRVSSEAGTTGQLVSDQSGKSSVPAMLISGTHFRAYLQPIVDLEKNLAIGCEMLTRSTIPALESPDDFFRASTEQKILTAVDLACLKTCLRAVDGWSKATRVHVNLFPSTIIDTPVDRLLSLFQSDGQKHKYCIEISEQQFIGDPSNLRERILVLKNEGILIGIDDVGFGRSSLESLIVLEPDVVKIAPKYVIGVTAAPFRQKLLTRLARLVQALGAEIVAEGIETAEALAIVRNLGIPYGQGFLWGRPAPAAENIALCKEVLST